MLLTRQNLNLAGARSQSPCGRARPAVLARTHLRQRRHRMAPDHGPRSLSLARLTWAASIRTQALKKGTAAEPDDAAVTMLG